MKIVNYAEGSVMGESGLHFGLYVALVGFLSACAIWALGAIIASRRLGAIGRRLTILSLGGAALVGIAPRLGFEARADTVPNVASLQATINGLGAGVLLVALVGIIVSTIMWAFGSLVDNARVQGMARRATLACVMISFAVGAATGLVNGAVNLGS